MPEEAQPLDKLYLFADSVVIATPSQSSTAQGSTFEVVSSWPLQEVRAVLAPGGTSPQDARDYCSLLLCRGEEVVVCSCLGVDARSMLEMINTTKVELEALSSRRDGRRTMDSCHEDESH